MKGQAAMASPLGVSLRYAEQSSWGEKVTMLGQLLGAGNVPQLQSVCSRPPDFESFCQRKIRVCFKFGLPLEMNYVILVGFGIAC